MGPKVASSGGKPTALSLNTMLLGLRRFPPQEQIDWRGHVRANSPPAAAETDIDLRGFVTSTS
jgi:hypothetical protein